MGAWYEIQGCPTVIWSIFFEIFTIDINHLPGKVLGLSGYTCMYCYIMIYSAVPLKRSQFSSKSHKRHPIVRPWGREMGVFCEFSLWLSSVPVGAVSCMIRYIGSLYNGTWLYIVESVRCSQDIYCDTERNLSRYISANIILYFHFIASYIILITK